MKGFQRRSTPKGGDCQGTLPKMARKIQGDKEEHAVTIMFDAWKEGAILEDVFPPRAQT